MLRPQTWYLLLAAICMVVCAIAGGGTVLQLVLLLVAAVLTLVDIALFARRKVQANLLFLPLLILVAWYVLLAVYAVPEIMHWNYALPAVAIVLLLLGQKGILHDEKVVRSYDRIR